MASTETLQLLAKQRKIQPTLWKKSSEQKQFWNTKFPPISSLLKIQKNTVSADMDSQMKTLQCCCARKRTVRNGFILSVLE